MIEAVWICVDTFVLGLAYAFYKDNMDMIYYLVNYEALFQTTRLVTAIFRIEQKHQATPYLRATFTLVKTR